MNLIYIYRIADTNEPSRSHRLVSIINNCEGPRTIAYMIVTYIGWVGEAQRGGGVGCETYRVGEFSEHRHNPVVSDYGQIFLVRSDVTDGGADAGQHLEVVATQQGHDQL